MKVLKDREGFAVNSKAGFSLVEMVIVIAILGILSGVTISAVTYLRNGQAKKSAAEVSAALDKLRVDTMTKDTDKYLYLYQDGNGIYMKMIPAEYTNSSQVVNDPTSATNLGNSTLWFKVTGKRNGTVVSDAMLNASSMIKIGYDRSNGAFLYCNDGNDTEDTFYNTIEISKRDGSGDVYSIQLVKLTGKHLVR